MKYQEKIYPFKLELTKVFIKKTKDNDKEKFEIFLNRVVFPTEIKTYQYLMVKYMVYANWRYPIALLPEHSIILGSVDLYLSPELYAKNKSFMRDFKEKGEVKVTSDMLQFF